MTAQTTARFLTRAGTTLHNTHATVDITDDPIRSTATCQPCGWTRDHGIDYRHHVLKWAQAHADGCTALPTT